MLRKLTCLLALTGGCLLVLSASSEAQKEKTAEPAKEAQKAKKVEPTKEEIEKANAEIRHERLQKMMMAYDLAAQGRTKNAPEYLITAAGMLRLLSSIKDLQEMKKLDVKLGFTDGDGKTERVKELKAPSLLEQSDELFKEASDMGATLNINVDKLIKRAKERETTDKEERAILGGSWSTTRRIEKKGALGNLTYGNFLVRNCRVDLHTYRFTMPTKPAKDACISWSFRTLDSIHPLLKVSVSQTYNTGQGQVSKVLFQNIPMNDKSIWNPGFIYSQGFEWASFPGQVDITITNENNYPVTYFMSIQ